MWKDRSASETEQHTFSRNETCAGIEVANVNSDRYNPLTICCPYCLVGIEFRPMIAYKDGRFICRDCAHTVRPGVPEYRCSCRPCLRMVRGEDAGMGRQRRQI